MLRQAHRPTTKKAISAFVEPCPSIQISISMILHKTILALVYMDLVAEFLVSICSTPKFICTSDEGVPRLLITENYTSYKSNIYKNRMM